MTCPKAIQYITCPRHRGGIGDEGGGLLSKILGMIFEMWLFLGGVHFFSFNMVIKPPLIKDSKAL